MFIVKLVHNGSLYWLRSTVWTSDPERAQKYNSHTDAVNALSKAGKFYHAKMLRNVVIEELPE